MSIPTKPIRWKVDYTSAWQRYNLASESGLTLNRHGEYPAHLVTISHVSVRASEDVLRVFIGGGIDEYVDWFWFVHSLVSWDNPEHAGSGYEDLPDFISQLNLTTEEKKTLLGEITTELQEMVDNARENAGLDS